MNQAQTIYQVSDLTNEMRKLMEVSYPEIWIEGELSSLSAPASGHLYFSLKDEKSQLRCAMFKGRASVSRYKPKTGDLVRVRAKISVYTARGDLQCIVQHIEEAGEGLLQRRFEELKHELNRQGLFDTKYKKAIPNYPSHIGVVTSPSGAAVKDVLTTLKRRCAGIPVTIYPAVVQGDGAAKSLNQALRDVVKDNKADVIILTRGGGSLEDLWCFNHDGLAQTIFDCPIPIVCGVGHEVDITIADLVADARAATPTAAAELISPDSQQLTYNLARLGKRLPNLMQRSIANLSQAVDLNGRQIRHPKQMLNLQKEKLKTSQRRLGYLIQQTPKWQRSSYQALSRRLTTLAPQKLIISELDKISSLSSRLLSGYTNNNRLRHNKFEAVASQLNAVSPLATLGRGFSITRNEQGDIVRDAEQLESGSKVSVQLGQGSVACTVDETNKE
ncbi:MAG: exodeoxyribonuclease VII large subunit [Gammaproteobacteria bacterium]|nr:exodeoxyribonuclease VII large subunit [Gammaproteobacteria bacterium]